jgi:microcompartment protein CcmL/EutN
VSATLEYNLALIEVLGLAPALVIADHALKAADVTIVGVEGNAGTDSLIKLVGDAGNVARALEAATEVATEMHAKFNAKVILRFSDSVKVPFIVTPQEYSPITCGFLHMLPREDPPDSPAGATAPTKGKHMQAIGMLETQGLVAVIEGADAMLKSANVELIGKEKIGAAHVTIMVRGDVAAVKAAVEAGKAAAEKVGKVVAAHVIARPHEALAKLLPA